MPVDPATGRGASRLAFVRVVFAGTPEVALPSLQALVDAGHHVVGVVTRPDAAVGRSKRLQPSPVARLAGQLGLAVLKPTKASDPAFQSQLRDLAPEVCAVIAYGALLPQSVLDIPKHGWVNVHFSLLPAWRGAAPVQRAIMAGDEQTGVTTFRLVREMDAGPCYRQISTPIADAETAGRLLDRLSHVGAELLLATLDDIQAGVTPREQDLHRLSLAPKVTVDEVRIDWTRSARHIDRLVRGASPNPGAWTTLDDQRFKVLLAGPDTSGVALDPGQLHATKRAVFVGTGDGDLRLDTVQAFGKSAMSGADWARGANPEGVRFV